MTSSSGSRAAKSVRAPDPLVSFTPVTTELVTCGFQRWSSTSLTEFAPKVRFAGAKGIRTHGPTMKGADFEPRLAPTIAIARDGSLCFRHLSPAIRGTVSSNPACSSGESAANLTSIRAGWADSRGERVVRPEPKHADGEVLCRGVERGSCPVWQARHLQYRSGRAIRQRRIHHDAAGSRDRDQHGWTRALPR